MIRSDHGLEIRVMHGQYSDQKSEAQVIAIFLLLPSGDK
jgi:hypothetical protein